MILNEIFQYNEFDNLMNSPGQIKLDPGCISRDTLPHWAH